VIPFDRALARIVAHRLVDSPSLDTPAFRRLAAMSDWNMSSYPGSLRAIGAKGLK
jgi:hypothetical protein